jgi:hypothetical protein
MYISDAVQLGKDSAYAKEITKHEANYTQYGPPGRPYEYRPYPTMMYRASRPKEGGAIPDFDQMEAGNDHERESCERQGFVYGGKAEALAALERQEFEFAELAANRELNDRKMSDKARTEATRVDDAAGIQHVPNIGEANKKTGRRE